MENAFNADRMEQLRSQVGHAYVRYRIELARYLATTCRCAPAEVEDIVQTAFTRLQEKIDQTEIQNPKAFLYKTAYNLAIDIGRHRKVQETYILSHSNEQPSADECGPERQTDARQRLGVLAKALWNMPSKRRKLLLMNRCENLSYAEIARRIGISEAAVRKHIAKALQDCHKAMF